MPTRRAAQALALIAAIWAGVAIVFAFTDLSISEALYHPQARWAMFFEIFGEHPAMLMAYAASMLLLASAPSQPKRTARALWLLAAPATLVSGMLLPVLTIQRSVGIDLTAAQLAGTFIASALASLLLLKLLRRIPAVRRGAWNDAAWFSLALVAAEFAIVHLMKLAWGRVRFRDLLPDRSNFTSWLTLQGANGHRSFPSAHAANSWTLLLLTAFVPARRQAVLGGAWIVVLIWGATTAYSRIVLGAHYASDVWTGSAVTIGLFLALRPFFVMPSRPVVLPRRAKSNQRAL